MRLQPPQQPRRGNKGIVVVISILVVLVVLAGAAFAGFHYLSPHSPSTVTNQPSTTPTTGSGASTGSTATTTTTTSTSTAATPTATAALTGNYTAIAPGPGCDTNGGTWTPQNIAQISCGTQLSVNGNTTGYLYFQLPNSTAFSASNIIGVLGGLGNASAGYCVGLAEQGANSGYLAEYCGDGNWYVYSISNGGATIKTLSTGLTSTRSGEQLSLQIKGSTLSFSIDTEVYNVTITPIQPTRVAITFATGYYGSNVTVKNFSYTILS